MQRVLGTATTHEIDAAAMDEERMQQISRSLEELAHVIPAATMAPLVQALGALGALDHQENQLEAELYRLEQEREEQLDRLLIGLRRAGDQVATTLEAKKLPKDAARVRQWARTMATQYAYYEVLASIDGLDAELQDLIAWLRELEGGGLTKEERLKIRALFGQWGGVRLLEKRRVPELRRQILRWLEWKEKGILPAERVSAPDRGLGPQAAPAESPAAHRRTAGRKRSRRAAGGDSGVDPQHPLHRAVGRLEAARGHPAARSAATGAHFDLTFYVDDIKMEHFSRQSRIISDVLMDAEEVFKRDGIESSRGGADHSALRPQAGGRRTYGRPRIPAAGFPRCAGDRRHLLDISL